MAGWIYVPDTGISYPVLVSDDDYYLYRDINGNKDYHGSIYSRSPLSQEVTLFGHNMRDGSMFAGIHRMRKEDFAAAHPYAYLYTDGGWRQYRFKEAVISRAESISIAGDDVSLADSREDGKETGTLTMITCAGEGLRLVARWTIL